MSNFFKIKDSVSFVYFCLMPSIMLGCQKAVTLEFSVDMIAGRQFLLSDAKIAIILRAQRDWHKKFLDHQRKKASKHSRVTKIQQQSLRLEGPAMIVEKRYELDRQNMQNEQDKIERELYFPPLAEFAVNRIFSPIEAIPGPYFPPVLKKTV